MSSAGLWTTNITFVMSVITHANHGKSTLIDSLMAVAGIIAQEVADEPLKSYKGERNRNEYLINLIDSHGHVDFSTKVPKTRKGKKKALPVNKDRFISKMFLRGDYVIIVLRNPK